MSVRSDVTSGGNRHWEWHPDTGDAEDGKTTSDASGRGARASDAGLIFADDYPFLINRGPQPEERAHFKPAAGDSVYKAKLSRNNQNLVYCQTKKQDCVWRHCVRQIVVWIQASAWPIFYLGDMARANKGLHDCSPPGPRSPNRNASRFNFIVRPWPITSQGAN